eukprot:m.259467 g.259467  ORF g.259467 m.259467 type:complete len:74 (+) comp16204_c0_seq1:3701-3922(+)
MLFPRRSSRIPTRGMRIATAKVTVTERPFRFVFRTCTSKRCCQEGQLLLPLMNSPLQERIHIDLANDAYNHQK